MDGTSRYVDAQALAFAIVHALDRRDDDVRSEIAALRRQVSALGTVSRAEEQADLRGLRRDVDDVATLLEALAIGVGPATADVVATTSLTG